jgi:hypothetical protein
VIAPHRRVLVKMAGGTSAVPTTARSSSIEQRQSSCTRRGGGAHTPLLRSYARRSELRLRCSWDTLYSAQVMRLDRVRERLTIGRLPTFEAARFSPPTCAAAAPARRRRRTGPPETCPRAGSRPRWRRTPSSAASPGRRCSAAAGRRVSPAESQAGGGQWFRRSVYPGEWIQGQIECVRSTSPEGSTRWMDG